MFDGIEKQYNKLLIVAHLDDETLCGYYQMKNSTTRVNEL